MYSCGASAESSAFPTAADPESPVCSPPYKKSKHTRPAKSSQVVTEAQVPLLAPSAVVPVSCIMNDAFRLGTEPALVPAESLALRLLTKDSLEHSDILELWARIPMCKRLKPPQAHAQSQSYLVLGLSPRLPEHLTTPTFPLQHTVRVLTQFVKQHFPELRYTTLSLQTNCNKGPHRDLNNADAPAFLHAYPSSQEVICGFIPHRARTLCTTRVKFFVESLPR